jgi:hypothetical protein
MRTGKQLSTGKRRRRNPAAKLTNPLIAALLQFKQRQSAPPSRVAMIPLGYDPSSPLNRLPPFCCDERLVYDIAIPVLRAFVIGDPQIVKTLKEAIKKAAHIFRRDREPVLYWQALEYRFGEGRGLGVEEFKRNLEARFNHGEPFAQHRWNPVRKSLGLPKLKTGTAASKYNWESRREKLRENRRSKRRKSDTE